MISFAIRAELSSSIRLLSVATTLACAAAIACRADMAMAEDRQVDFIRDVMPVLNKVGCTGGKCHGSFQGRGGFQLSLLGFNPRQDYEALVKQARGRRISPAAPDSSLALRKALGKMPHGGGIRFTKNDDSYRILRDWIAGGAVDAADQDLHVERIVVSPSEVVLSPGDKAAIQVTAHWSDGARRDVSNWAVYEARDENYAEVSPSGEIAAIKPGRTAVTVSYMGGVAAVTVTIPYAKVAERAEFAANNFIDELIAVEWQKMGFLPAETAGDGVFARRAYLDIIGTLPTRAEIDRFVASEQPGKRAKLIDELLERPQYVDYWATKWGDLLRVHRRYVGEKGLWTFWGWLRQALRENRPVDRMTRELLTSKGSLYANGATAFYYVDEKPADLAETTSQVFLGIRLQCARCHHHPYEIWSQEDYYGLANFFTRIELKDNQDGGRYGGAKLLKPIAKASRDRRVQMPLPPKVFGHLVDPEATADVRQPLADWITAADNPFFARNIVNRYWSYLMGRGLVEPVDDLRATNPASHPELLDRLAADFVAHQYDLKHLIRTICNSRTYQLAAEVAPARDQNGMFYTHARYRRLPAAVLFDAVCQATGTSEPFEGLPAGTRAISLPDPAIPSYFLETFGRSSRASPCECATSTAPDLAQALHLINSSQIDAKLSSAKGRIAQLLKSKQPTAEFVDDLYYAALSRRASETEQKKSLEFIESAPSKQEGVEDLLWTLLNSTEFVFNH